MPVEQAYRRSDALEKRRRRLADWAVFCGQGRALRTAHDPNSARPQVT